MVLRGYDQEGRLVEEVVLSTDRYYDGENPLIDDPDYRHRRRIARVTGSIWGASRKPDQEFENRYAPNGAFLGGRTVHADGTVTE